MHKPSCNLVSVRSSTEKTSPLICILVYKKSEAFATQLWEDTKLIAGTDCSYVCWI